MRLTVRGWARDHGQTTLLEADLDELPPRIGVATYQRNQPVLQIRRRQLLNRSRRVTGVSVSGHANIRLGGDYLVQAFLTKSEIARLFYLTHQGELNGLLDTFKPISDAEASRAEAEAEELSDE